MRGAGWRAEALVPAGAAAPRARQCWQRTANPMGQPSPGQPGGDGARRWWWVKIPFPLWHVLWGGNMAFPCTSWRLCSLGCGHRAYEASHHISSPGAPPDTAPAAAAAQTPKALGPPPLGPVNLALRTESARPAAEESSEGSDVPADAVLGPLRETLASCRPTMQVRPKLSLLCLLAPPGRAAQTRQRCWPVEGNVEGWQPARNPECLG